MGAPEQLAAPPLWMEKTKLGEVSLGFNRENRELDSLSSGRHRDGDISPKATKV